MTNSSWKYRLVDWIRRDWLIISLYLVATLVMTYPLVARLDGQWLAASDPDAYVKMWDNWWFEQRALAGEPLFYTRDIFYPIGVDLTYHSISWSVVVGSWLLSGFVGQAVAYNLTVLVGIFTTGYAAYLMIYPLVRHQAAAWLGGLVYTFAPYHLSHSPNHPDLIHLAFIPLSVLLLSFAITQADGRKSLWAALGAGLMIGLAAFTSLYIMVFALITVSVIVGWLALDKGRWRDKGFWRLILVAGITCVPLLLIRLGPIMSNPGALGDAIESKYTATVGQTDLLAFIVPSRHHPVFRPFVNDVALGFIMNAKWPAYLGLFPLILSALAITWKQRFRQITPWLTLGLIFVILSLGPVLRFNGQLYESVKLPAGYLAWFPPIRAVGRPDFFVLGVLLPLAVCAAYGLDRLLISLGDQRMAKYGLTILFSGLLLFEFWNGPMNVVGAWVNPFFEQVAGEEGYFGLIQMPMGRQEAKIYMFQQTFHQKPLVNGLIARTPEEAFEYIEGNYLLNSWMEERVLHCREDSIRSIQFALTQLVDDGFRYAIVHKQNDVEDIFKSYFPIAPVYEDDELAAYLLNDLQENPPCSSARLSPADGERPISEVFYEPR